MLIMLLICLPALFLRHVVFKKPLGLWISITFAFCMFVIAMGLNEVLANASILRAGQDTISAGVVISFFILYKKKKIENFYYYDGNANVGPIEGDEMVKLYTSGAIHSQTPVVREGEQDWKTLGNYRFLPPVGGENARIQR